MEVRTGGDWLSLFSLGHLREYSPIFQAEVYAVNFFISHIVNLSDPNSRI